MLAEQKLGLRFRWAKCHKMVNCSDVSRYHSFLADQYAYLADLSSR
jgi:hypothetical protein